MKSVHFSGKMVLNNQWREERVRFSYVNRKKSRAFEIFN